MEIGVEVRKVDSQGRFILPADWRGYALKDTHEVYVVKRKDYLKVIPKRRVDLKKFFDKVDLGVDAIRGWEAFEKSLVERSP